MKHMLGYDFVAFACWGGGEGGQPGERSEDILQNNKDLHTPWEPARGIGRLISGRAGTPDDVP